MPTGYENHRVDQKSRVESISDVYFDLQESPDRVLSQICPVPDTAHEPNVAAKRNNRDLATPSSASRRVDIGRTQDHMRTVRPSRVRPCGGCGGEAFASSMDAWPGRAARRAGAHPRGYLSKRAVVLVMKLGPGAGGRDRWSCPDLPSRGSKTL